MATLLEYAERGPFAVGLETLEIRDPVRPQRILPTDVWYPAAPWQSHSSPRETASHPLGRPHAAVPNLPPANGPFPLLVFSHGNSGLRRQSTFLTTHLASWGYLVAAPDHPGNTFPETFALSEEDRRRSHFEARRNRPLDVQAVIDALLASPHTRPHIDVERIAVFGHSFGGYTALKMPRLDPRVRAVCGLAPASEPFVGRKAFEPDELPFTRRIPVLLVAAMDDALVDLETSVWPLYQRLGAPKALVGIQQTDHFHFCDGVEILHGMHHRNPRLQQLRPTLPYTALLAEARVHRILCGVVGSYFARAFSAGMDPCSQFNPDHLATLDPTAQNLDSERRPQAHS